MIFLFDLDQTVICSKHRQLTKPCGSLDLEHWKENCTPEKVAQDSLLPLADSMRSLFTLPHNKIVICTARVMSAPDWQFLARHNLPFHDALHRAPDDTRGDAEYKYSKIWSYLTSQKIPRNKWSVSVCLVDDNTKVLEMARRELKIMAVDSVSYNELLKAQA